MDFNILSSFVSGSLGICAGWFLCRRFAPLYKRVSDLRACHGDMKMVLVVRKDLKMGNGKIAAQCSHAALGCYELTREVNPEILDTWIQQGQPKIVLKIETYEEMLELSGKAKSSGLVNMIVHDAGHTQIPEGSATVLGIGPDLASHIDEVSGHLKLL